MTLPSEKLLRKMYSIDLIESLYPLGELAYYAGSTHKPQMGTTTTSMTAGALLINEW